VIEGSHKNSDLKYRPDIDGLRCIAVLSVLAFHLSPARMPGGFVGVDVFFVISGYLISTIIFSEVSKSEFSILAFYDRRIRRIFPALFTMLICVSIILSFLLLPQEFVDYSKSLISATWSSSNFYFWKHSGYFDTPTAKPLLHTWSLAVEEQFYLLFPIALVVSRRFFPEQLRRAVLVLFFASLGASVFAVHYNVDAAYYLPNTRAWELLLGTLISLGFFPLFRPAWMRNIATLLGFGMILYACFRYSAQTPFPGLAALVPCIGSALIIAVGQAGPSVVGNLLSWRPVVFVGLISYSLYLWHWPIIVLNGLGLPLRLGRALYGQWTFMPTSQISEKAVELVAAFVVAILSWRFVERPFRSHARRIRRRYLFLWSATAMGSIFLAAGTVILAKGFPQRFSPRALQVASFLVSPGATTLGQLGDCSIDEHTQLSVFQNENCLTKREENESYLLLGDSHAGALWGGMRKSIPNVNVQLAAVWGCRPSLQPKESPLCKEMMQFIFQRYLPSHSIRALLLQARWYPDSLSGISEIAAWAKAHSVPLVVLGPVAEYDAPLPRLLAYSITWNKPHLAHEHLSAYSSAMDNRMRALADKLWRVPYVSLYEATCEANLCIEYADAVNGIPLLNDSDHLSEAGSEVLMRRVIHSGAMQVMHESIPLNKEAKLLRLPIVHSRLN
jgi:peptidoglycan/LPS O-acetylase OafA/YrhL